MSLPRVLSWIGVIVLAVGSLAVATRSDGHPPTPAARTERIAAELRCPNCQGLSVLGSDSPTARSIRDDIARRVADGQTDADIRHAYVDRYGQWILLRPQGRGIGVFVWAVPVVAAVGALAGLTFALRRWRPRLTGTATPDDRAVVERALGHRLGGGP